MNSHTHSLQFWKSREDTALSSAKDMLGEVIRENIVHLVSYFYEILLKHERASQFLNHAMVQERLGGALTKWLLTLLDFDPKSDADGFSETQRTIGKVHARMNIPVNLVLEGASGLKTAISEKVLTGYHNRDTAEAIVLLNELIDYAMLQMSAAYVEGISQHAKVEEAYRLFTLGQDVGVERESQRAALMEWSQAAIFGLFGSEGSPRLDAIGKSEFGLWLRHRGSVMFQGALMLKKIEKAMEEIDGELIPQIEMLENARVAQAAPLVARLQARIEEIKFLLADLFQSLSASANARDPLTSALNRKFLPSILGREVMLSLQQGTPLSILMIDVDHFKTINDTWGHSAGDLVLRQVAETIADNSRAADIIFRYGGEEFLVALVETGIKQANEVAERIRDAFMGRELKLADGTTINATVSIGLAEQSGHPDFQHLIDDADRALYQAKKQGRNRVQVA